MTRIASYFRAPTKPKVADRADRQALKRTVIDSKTGEINFDHLNKLLGHYPNARTLYAKKDWLGRLYVSFNEPEDGKYEYADKKALGTLAKLGLTDSFVGYKQAVFDAKQDLLSNLNSHGGGFEVTAKFRQAALTLEKAQKDGPTKQETPQAAGKSEAPSLSTAESSSRELEKKSVQTGPDIEAENKRLDNERRHATSDGSAFFDMKELDNFQTQLRQGEIKRPEYPQILTYVEELNSIHRANSNRVPERNQVADLLEFICSGKKLKPMDALGLEHRPINVFGNLSFNTPYAAAHFLFEETTFLRDLNQDDSEHYKAIYLNAIQQEIAIRAVEATVAVDADESGQRPVN